MNPLQKLIASVRNQLYANALLRCMLLGAAAFVSASALTSLLAVQLGALVVALGAGVFITKIYAPKKPEAVSLIHQKVQGTEYSLALLEKENPNWAEQLQLERLYDRIENEAAPRVFFAQLWPYGLLVVLAFLFRLAVPLLGQNSGISKESETLLPAKHEKKILPPPSLQTARIRIQPPAYSGLHATESSDLNVTALNGSRLTWQVQLSQADGVTLRLSDGKNSGLVFKKNGDSYEYSDRLVHSGIYNLKAYRADSLVYQSEFYRLEAQPDQPPKITPASKELYRYHLLNDPKKISVSAKISDDFRVQNAFIVATLARGSGENVKFREVRLPLSPATFKEANLTKVLDLKALDFTPGDELYYYWAAVDNRQPEANFTKSDTYFIVYRDTTQMEEAQLATMAVNRMPEYFRSQRQIIIDTEKLIAKRKKLPPKEFNSTSNEIGFDQKVLRLRYGQFMGEEFETNIGGANPAEDHGGDAPGSASLEGFMHKHDTEEEHAAVAEVPDHDHNHGTPVPAGQQDPLAALMEQYVHSHDDGEVNTFHEQSTRSLLKMALEQMWQSELHLRLYEPEKALPFENKALEYLKTAQQKARTYVKKSGFDPPPLKIKETRLTGELDKINPRYQQERHYEQEQLAIKASRVLGYLELPKLSAAQQRDVQQVGTQLAETTINSGLKNWAVLGDLQKLASGKKLNDKERQRTQAFLLTLANPTWQTGSDYRSQPKLEAAFWRQLL
ncbi:hypothetical protein [Salmonirosea aquatica]|uniref:DUF4175 family protein n=1 Tax=Salmonirosea aquatica TaxID=2654236 RepID=A0A7C9FZ90_9BACT|nr:hypothetical protein [Cytophagaceae bacterium SJW1-29]